MTHHPNPGGSYTWFHDDAWLDFNYIQTYSNANTIVDRITQGTPDLPESRYLMRNLRIIKARVSTYLVTIAALDQRVYRSQMYWSVLSGAPGHIFGNTIVYIFDRKTMETTIGLSLKMTVTIIGGTISTHLEPIGQ